MKTVFLRDDMFTEFDRRVIAGWEQGFVREDEDGKPQLVGSYGVAPGLEHRMTMLREAGYRWFPTVCFVLGRRSGKGYMGALITAYQVFYLLSLGDPQAHYGIDRDKQIKVLVFATDARSAKRNQYRDLKGFVEKAPCFRPYVEYVGPGEIRLFTPAQVARMAAGGPRETGLIVIEALPTTGTAARGPGAIGLVFDEFAHLADEGLHGSGDEILAAAEPTQTTFGLDAFIYMASSPADMTGPFYETAMRGLELDDAGQPADPSVFMVQLPSWDVWLDWEQTLVDENDPGQNGLEMWPGGDQFPPLKRALVVYDERMRRKEMLNRDTFAVEYRAQWRTSMFAYLPQDHVKQIFEPYDGSRLKMQTLGRLDRHYFMHFDSSVSGANFAIVIGRVEVNECGERHVVIDFISVARPSDFENGEIDYGVMGKRIFDLAVAFLPPLITHDGYNTTLLVQRLEERLRAAGLPRLPKFLKRTPTHQSNWAEAELFKTAIAQNLVHAPMHKLAFDELVYLQCRKERVNPPSSGPVRTADVADCLFSIVMQALGGNSGTLEAMSAFGAHNLSRNLTPTTADQAVFDQMSRGMRRGPDHRAGNPARGRPGYEGY